MIKSLWAAAALGMMLLSFSVPVASAQDNEPPPPEAAARGQKQFQQNCAFCHGASAAGGAEGPSLTLSALVRHDRVGDLVGPVIREGRTKECRLSLSHRSRLQTSGAAGSETWPNKESLLRGGGPTWVTGTYDPNLNLIYWGTGNPHPVLAGVVRKGDNLYTCSIVALNADTGKLVWFFQPSPHDTHDGDAVETRVLFDARFHGKQRKLLAQASRNGYFFVLDRTNGEALVTTKFVPSNWATRTHDKRQPVSDPNKEPQPDGALTKSSTEGATNWQAPSFDPQTGLFYVNAVRGYSIWYLALDGGKAEDHQGGGASDLWSESELVALDYETGKPRWIRKNGDRAANSGILSTAGGLLFTCDMGANLLALDAGTGAVLWHFAGGAPLNSAPMTYEIDGKQFVFTAAGSVAFAWTLPAR